MKTTILSARHVRSIVADVGLDALMDELIEEFAQACADFDTSKYSVPARSGFHYSHPTTGLIEWMPTLEKGENVSVKMVSYHPDNPGLRELPTILSSLLVFDVTSGHLSTIMDGTFLTAMRTGAASAVASRVLASSESTSLGLIGCGAQAVTQVHALSRVFDIRTVSFFDPDQQTMDSFPERLRQLELGRITLEAASIEDVVANCDIVCTCTSIEIGEGPVFADEGLKPWVHINAVGSDFPGKFELPRSVLLRSLVVPDFVAQAMAEGECQQLRKDEIGPDLVAIVSQPEKFSEHRDRPTVFDSTGWSLEDHTAAKILARHAQRLGVGTEIQIESVSGDPKDPYGFTGSAQLGVIMKVAASE